MSEDRRLAAIMFTDIVGYTALMGSDEDRAFKILRKNREIQRPIIKKYRGEWLKEMGDGILASFHTASDAVRCAGEIQQSAKKEGIALRIGIHSGEVVFEGHDVLGDGVNVASRLEELAKEGCINISGAIYKDIKNKAGISAEFIEEKELKNVDEPVKVYRVETAFNDDEITENKKTKSGKSKLPYYLLASIMVVLIVVIIWQFVPNTEITPLVQEVESAEPDKSIAVLPFTDISPNKDQEYFSDGMMDAILMHLCKIGDLKVTSRTSIMQYKGTTKTTPQIAEELGVAHILEGSVSKSGDRIRIIAQLIDATNDKHLWAETYDRELADVFDIQSDVAQQIASALKATIIPDVKERIENIPTENLEAYEYYLKGNETYWSSWQRLEISKTYKSIDLYQKAIELDDRFSFAYTGVGRSYWWLAHQEKESIRPELWEKSKDYLYKALELDSSNGWAYAELAVVTSNYDWDSTLTRTMLDKAIELMPNDENAYIHYLWHEARLENCDKIRWIIEARKRFNSWIEHPYSNPNLAWLACQGKYPEIIAIAKEYWDLGLYPQLAFSIFDAAIAIDSFDIANKVVEYVKEGVDGKMTYYVLKATLSAREGNREIAYQLLDSLDIISNLEFTPNALYASIYAALAEKDQMYKYLDIGLTNREKELHDIVFYPVFDIYENEPRFKEIKRKMWIPLESNKE